MGDSRKLEYLIVRYVPNIVREEFVNIGLVMTESGGDGGGFFGMHFTKDWRRARCHDPNLDLEMLEALGREVQQRLMDSLQRPLLLHQMMDSYSNAVQLSEVQHCVSADPERELEYLAGQLIEMPRIPLADLGKVPRTAGRSWILSRMSDEFVSKGIWGALQRDLPAAPYTNEMDKFTFDYAYAFAKEMKVFQAVSLTKPSQETRMFPWIVAKVRPRMAASRGEAISFTAVVENDFDEEDERVKSVLAFMRDEEIRVAPLREMAAIAETARMELGV
jgi:hypothetical protein